MTITLATLFDATPQEVFDQAVRHLLTQRQRAVNADGGCVYRVPNTDLKCAAGAFISDEEYRPDMEGKTIHAVVVDESLMQLEEAPLEVLLALQTIHDNYDAEEWPEELGTLAASYGLDSSVLNEFTH